MRRRTLIFRPDEGRLLRPHDGIVIETLPVSVSNHARGMAELIREFRNGRG